LCIKTWRAKWTVIITLFGYPSPIRKAIYTTNAHESVNSVNRKSTRWKQALNHFVIIFEGRIPELTSK
jgi:transposase-like protein